MNSKTFLSSLLVVGITTLTLLVYVGCKKLDLVRIAAVRTDPASNIYSDQAKVNAEIIDLGEESALVDHGFCWSTGTVPPTINNSSVSLGVKSDLITFFYTITGLAPNTTHKFRAYIKNNSEIYYGEVYEFKTLPGTTPTGEWLHYDDGINFDGIGLTEGGSFDVAIRFTSFDLQDYDGFQVTRVKFFPKAGSPIEYYVTLWDGNTPDLVYAENVSNINVGNWTEYYPTEIYTINSNIDMWIGYWVFEHPAGIYPAGVDDGPAVSGYGDLFSQDDGDTWDSLADLGLNCNWNLQVYVTNEKGVEVELVKRNPHRPTVDHDVTNAQQNNISSLKMSNQN
ncbi:MAG: hypothetical protein JW731_11440 [Bacteroidales bacterium]|nr:hypothetical protein [Bacteroidales bacterium]